MQRRKKANPLNNARSKNSSKTNLKKIVKRSNLSPAEKRELYKKILLVLYPKRFPSVRKKMIKKELSQKQSESQKKEESENDLLERKRKQAELKEKLLNKKRKPSKKELKEIQDTLWTVNYLLKQMVAGKEPTTLLRRMSQEIPWALSAIRKRNPELVEKAFLLDKRRRGKKNEF